MKMTKVIFTSVCVLLFSGALASCSSTPEYSKLSSAHFPAKVKALTFNSNSGKVRLDKNSPVKKGAWEISFPRNKKPTATYSDRGCQNLVFVRPLVCKNKLKGNKSCELLYELGSHKCSAMFKAKCYIWISGQKTPIYLSCDEIIFE